MRRASLHPLTVGSLLLLGAVCLGEEASAPVPKPSRFTPDKILRDPFERIDAKRMVENRALVQSAGGDEDDLRAQLKVTGVVRDRLVIAIVNGKAFAEGDTLRLRWKEKVLPLRLMKVTESKVDFDYTGTILSVPITRQMPKLLQD